MPSVRVNRRAADRAASGHPWIFASDVLDRGGAQPGDTVTAIDPKGRPLGSAHYSSTSQITLRLLSSGVRAVDPDFFMNRIRAAEAFRRRVVLDSDAYRLVHGEGDLLPALIVDRYADCFAIQTLNQGMERAKPLIVHCLEELFQPRAIVERNDAPVRTREDLPLVSGVLAGELSGPVTLAISGLRLEADLLGGQKTGIFLDQRENYAAAAKYAHGRALDCFTSTGGFALHLSRSCESVEGVDSSAPALEIAARNAAANGIKNIQWTEGDVFELLASFASARRAFDTIVLDPPAFAKSRSAVAGAARGYKDINLRALRLLGPGGILVSCSCSHHMSEATLLGIVAEAALDARKTLRVLERRTQAMDHPILLTVPETHYLKCLILEVI